MSVLREALSVTALARREIQERWLVLAAGAVFGLVPVVASAFVPSVRAEASTLAVVEFFVAQALAALVGLGLLGDDFASGRMGWYFSRPLSGFAIWAGKVGGAGVLAVAVTWVMTLPALFLVQPREALFAALPLGFAGLVVCPLLFVGAGAVGGIGARGRSRWLLVDLACVILLGPVMVWASERIHVVTKAHHAKDFFEPVVLLVFTAAFLLGSATGVMIGRADARRAHAAASAAMWGILVPAQALLFGYVSWFLA